MADAPKNAGHRRIAAPASVGFVHARQRGHRSGPCWRLDDEGHATIEFGSIGTPLGARTNQTRSAITYRAQRGTIEALGHEDVTNRLTPALSPTTHRRQSRRSIR